MPVIDLEKCNKCLKCVKDCPSSAIAIETGEIANTCIHCSHCVAICPEMAVSPDFGDIFPLYQHSVNPDEFRKLSAGIRTCRSYLSKEIPEDVLLELVENMKHYPSASNARPIKITVVRSAEKVKLLNDLTAETLIRMIGFVCSPVVSSLIQLFAPSLGIENKRFNDLPPCAGSIVVSWASIACWNGRGRCQYLGNIHLDLCQHHGTGNLFQWIHYQSNG
jgi:ferredoxin